MAKVFVHGNPESSAIWGPLTAALAERGVDDVVLASPPGFGAPVPEGFEPTAAGYTRWLVGELEQHPGPVDLVGHDWGAGHTFGVVAERPDLLRSWAADCAGLLHPAYGWHDMAQLWQQVGPGEAWVDQVTSLPESDRSQIYEGLGVPPDIAASLARALDADMGRCMLALYRSAPREALDALADRVAAAQRRPGLVLDPTDDPYLPSALAEPVAARLGAERVALPGKGHWWMFDDVGAIVDRLVAFWRSA